MTHRTCTMCGMEKAFDQFNKHKGCKHGLSPTCRSCANTVSKACKQANKAQTYATVRAWVERNRDRSREIKRKWKEANKGAVLAHTRARQARQRMAVPAWADLEKIKAVYNAAAELRAKGFDVHVDHIVPLSGKDVTGFHVEYNLRIVDASTNMAKGNKLAPDVVPIAALDLA